MNIFYVDDVALEEIVSCFFPEFEREIYGLYFPGTTTNNRPDHCICGSCDADPTVLASYDIALLRESRRPWTAPMEEHQIHGPFGDRLSQRRREIEPITKAEWSHLHDAMVDALSHAEEDSQEAAAEVMSLRRKLDVLNPNPNGEWGLT